MQVSPSHFSQTYLLGDVNYQTVGLDDKGAIVEKYSDLINSLDDKTNFQLTIFNQKVNLEKFRKSILYPLQEDGFDGYRDELNRMMDANLEAGENNFSAVKLLSFGKSDQTPKLAFRSLSQIGEYFKSGFSEIDVSLGLLDGEERVNVLAEKMARTGIYLEKVGHVLENNIDEAEALLQTMTQTGDKLFDTVFLIGVLADTEDQLKQALDIIKQVAGSNDMIIDNLTYMQEAAFNSLLPFGKNYLEGVSRSLLTSNIAVNAPWTSVDIQDKGGKFYGINQISSNIISIDRGKLNTPSGLILGTSGAGKGMATKHEIISTKLKEADSDTEIIIVDPENEYSIIGQAFGGESIDIAPDSTTFLNVLELSDENMDEDPVKVKSEFLLSWIGKLLDRKMDGREKSLIDRVTRLTYKHFDTPSLVEWVFVLSQQPEQEAKNLALYMELYVEGSLDIFSHRTNIKTDSHFLIYNVKKLGDELKQIALMVIFDQIWNRVVKNQKLGKKTWIYFDEMQLLLLDKYASDFFFKLWSRVRKYGAIPTGITQNVETLLLDANGRRIIANSEFMILLKQAKSDREELVHLLGLSKELEKYLVNPEKGAGLIKAGSTVVPFKNKIPQHTKLFDIMSTDPEKMRT